MYIPRYLDCVFVLFCQQDMTFFLKKQFFKGALPWQRPWLGITVTLNDPYLDCNRLGIFKYIYLDTYIVFLCCLVTIIWPFLKFQFIITVLPCNGADAHTHHYFNGKQADSDSWGPWLTEKHSGGKCLRGDGGLWWPID